MFPIEPVILKCIDPRKTLTSHFARERASVESPIHSCESIFEQRPWVASVRRAAAVEIKRSFQQPHAKIHGLIFYPGQGRA